MMRGAIKLLALCCVAGGGAAGTYFYEHHHVEDARIAQLEARQRDLEAQKAELSEKTKQLQTVVERLSDEKRVAEVIVTDQKTVNSVLRTTLLFVEYAADGSTLPPHTFVIDGNTAHIDALVIKFGRDFVARNDPLKGHSIALFRRLYGETQSPRQGWPIDPPGVAPAVYKDGVRADSPAGQFERKLWKNFWRLADDRQYAKENGVRIANGQGVWGPFLPGRLYTLTLESQGGLNLTSEPMKGIYREAMKRQAATTTAVTRSE